MAEHSFLQSNEWAEFQRSLGRAPLEVAAPRSFGLAILSRARLLTGREVLEYSKDGILVKIIKHDLPFRKNYLYIPHGPEMDPERDREGSQRAPVSYGVDFNQMIGGFKNPVVNFVRWLREEAKKRKSIFVKAEPLIDSVAQALSETGFRKSKKEIQPSKTVVIDLGRSEEELLSGMHHKTRYNIGVADRHGVVVGESDDLDIFLKLLKKTAKRDKFFPHPDDYYRKLFSYNGLQTKMYLAKHDTRPVAAAFTLIYGDTGYYLHGASDYEHRSLMAPYALHWHIIKQLKAEGLKQYDLWGINPRKWPGITHFKLGWGGQTIEHPGSFDLTVSKFWHLIYKIIR